MCSYYDSQQFGRIEELFEQMQEMQIAPCVFSYSYAISAAARLGKHDDVLRIYAQMQGMNAQLPTTLACSMVMAALVKAGTRDGCVWTLYPLNA
jgi:pentatricopeptide repeat protein